MWTPRTTRAGSTTRSWQDTQATRAGNTVTFTHFGRADNLTLRTCKVLTNAIAGYMMTGDENMRWVVEEYSRGLAALSMVMDFGEDDPVRYLQARAPFTRNHEFDTVGGRHVVIDYDPVRREEDAWNARIVHNPENPHWGDVHFVNQRSKDDVPHMFRPGVFAFEAGIDLPQRDCATARLRGGCVGCPAARHNSAQVCRPTGPPAEPCETRGQPLRTASEIRYFSGRTRT